MAVNRRCPHSGELTLQEPSLLVSDPPRQLEFAVPGDSEGMLTARERIMDWVHGLALSEGEEIDIFLAVQEALANATSHGCSDQPGAMVHCRLEISATEITITVRDPGAGFDTAAAVANGGAGNIGEHGRGILLMRSLMDEVVFRRGGSEVVLRKRIHSQA